MYMSFDTNELTEGDKKVLAMLAENLPVTATPAAAEGEPAPAVEPEPAPKAAPAKKAPAKAAQKPAPAPEPAPEPEVTPEPEAAEEDLLGGEAEPEAEAPTMADAVAAATKLVSSGGAAKVKAALATVGAKRVSEVPEDKIAEFLSALDDA